MKRLGLIFDHTRSLEFISFSKLKFHISSKKFSVGVYDELHRLTLTYTATGMKTGASMILKIHTVGKQNFEYNSTQHRFPNFQLI